MVTVDDLVISLTIKETGKLGRLQKQLDAIVGKRGQRLGFGLGVLGNIPADIAFIKRQIQWIRPQVLPSRDQPKSMRKAFAVMLKQLEDYGFDIESKIMTARSKKGFMKEVGATTDEELRLAIRDRLKELKASISAIIEETSLLPPKKQEEALTVVEKLISQALHGREIGRMLWREIGKLVPEEIFKGTVYDLFRAISGEKPETEKSLYQVKAAALEKPEIQKELGLGRLPKGFDEMIKWTEDVLKSGGEITRSVTANIQDWMAQKTVADLIGAQNSPDKIAERLNTILKEEGADRVKEILEEIKEKLVKTPFTKEELEQLGEVLVFEDVKNKLTEIMKTVYGWKVEATEGAYRMDVHVENFEKIANELGIHIKSVKDVGIELKTIIEKRDIKQLLTYIKNSPYTKENAIIMAEQIADGVMEYAESKGLGKENIVILKELRKKQEKFGLAPTILTPEEVAKTVSELSKEIDDQKALIRDFLEHPETMGKEQLEQIIEFLSGFPKKFGLNPTQIDLPNEFSKLPTKEDLDRDLENIIDMINENVNFPNILETLEFTKNEMETLKELIVDLESSNKETVQNAVEELAKRLGINPNYIDLPEFIRNIGRNILDMAEDWSGRDVPEAGLLQRLFTLLAREITQKKEFTDLNQILSSLQTIQDRIGEKPEIGGTLGNMPILDKLDSIIKVIGTFQSDMKDMLSKRSYEPQRQNKPKGF